MNKKPLLFLDTSVLMSAIFSRKGGAALIVDLAARNAFKIVVTQAVITEARRKLKRKYSVAELMILYEILLPFQTRPAIKPSPWRSELEEFNQLIRDKDRHVLAGAKKYQVDYLITHDKKDFFTEKLHKANLPFKILTPRMFLQDYYPQSPQSR